MAETLTSESPKRLARGWRRYQELRKQDAADKAEIERGLLEGLGRPPTMNDRLAIEDIASLTIIARVAERRGQYAKAAKIRDQITRARRTNGFKPEPATPAANPAISPLEYWKQKQAQASIASPDESDESLMGDLPSVAGASS